MIDDAKIDERSVSWKALLPVSTENRVLAIGLTQEELNGVSRSYHLIDKRPRKPKYEIALVGKNIKDSGLINICLSCLSDSAVMVVCSDNVNRAIKNSNLTHCGAYAALPLNHPRLFIPLTSRKSIKAGLGFYSPGSLRNKAFLLFAKVLNTAGIVKHLRGNTINIWVKGKTSNEQLIKYWLSEKMGWPVGEIVIYTGADSVKRKITILAISSDYKNKIIAKIADTSTAVAAIKQESSALSRLSQSSLANLVPSLIIEDNFGPYFIQIQTALPKQTMQHAFLSNTHLDFLIKLSQINRHSLPINNTSEWRCINQTLDYPLPMHNILSKLKRYNFSDKKIDCHMVHGDFVPWNIIYKKDSILVYDWEDSIPLGLPFHDAFHFIYRQASLVGPWKGASVIINRMKSTSTFLKNAAKINCDINIALSIWCIKEYLNKPDTRLIDIATIIAHQINEQPS
jgi:uncharacterized protein YggU (UPF0235/DUF167 family)